VQQAVRMSYSTTTRVHCTGGDKATIILEVTNFKAALATVMKGNGIESQPCTIRGSKFIIKVYPSGHASAAKDKVSVYVLNKSQHKVITTFSIKIGNEKASLTEVQFKKGSRDEGNNWGWLDFMDRKDVGPTLCVVATIALLKEEGVFGTNDLQDTVKEMEAMTIKQTNKIKSEIKNELKQEFNKGLSDMKKRFEESETNMIVKMGKMENTLKARDPIKIPECPICFEELRPPLRIVQCLRGHKICEPCSKKEAVVSCPTNCKSGFMGRDHGMEAFVKQLLGEKE